MCVIARDRLDFLRRWWRVLLRESPVSQAGGRVPVFLLILGRGLAEMTGAQGEHSDRAEA